MFLLPALGLGFLLATVLGGRPSRVLETRFRASWLVLLALALQVAIFTRLAHHVDPLLRGRLHLASYALLLLFAALNVRTRLLIPLLVGLGLNAAAIAANSGKMPLSPTAAAAAGLAPGAASNVSAHSGPLGFLGDVFALPSQLPLANVFSLGDLLIGFGMIGFIVAVATHDGEAPALSLRRLVAPLRTRVYRRLAAGRLISQMGDWLTIAALVGWIYETTGSTGKVAGLLLIRLAPPILGSGLAAFVVDRLPKQRVLVGVELLRGAAVACALAAVLGSNRMLVYVAIGICGGLAAISGAVLPSLPPSILPDDLLPPANAGLGISKDIAMALGAAGGGIALSRVGVVPALVIDVLTFLAAAVLYMGLRGVAPARGERRNEREPSGLRYLLGQPAILLLITSFAAATLATGLTNATLPRFLGGSVGLGPGAYGFGIAAIAGGLALGEALVGFARVGPSAGRWIGAGLVLMAGFLALLGLTRHAPTALLLLGAIGFVDGTTDVLYQTIVQRRADPRYYGYIFGFSGAFMTSTMMGAFIAAPVANSVFGSGHVILVASATLLVAGALALAAMVRSQPSGATRSGERSLERTRLESGLEELSRRIDAILETVRRFETARTEQSNGDVRPRVLHLRLDVNDGADRAPVPDSPTIVPVEEEEAVYTEILHLRPSPPNGDGARNGDGLTGTPLDAILLELAQALEDERASSFEPFRVVSGAPNDPSRAA